MCYTYFKTPIFQHKELEFNSICNFKTQTNSQIGLIIMEMFNLTNEKFPRIMLKSNNLLYNG
ncbi:hypothetical protein GCM10007884_51610 [Methylobacterium brachythecii]|uniref:Uncharacterized protein n=1 Tax=Methylobacterium brachythecii TaxID=1176177 RepID=A0ABQ6DD28_9HYPH|nr:hypothetical protein GCM10007884_51610 [Methylobacterium brachythecii]